MKVKIIGYERIKGFSKKKNANYDYHILHAQHLKPLSGPGSGYQVERLLIADDAGIILDPPKPAEVWEIFFNRYGRIEDAYQALPPSKG